MRLRAALLLALLPTAAGCHMPADPQGSYDRIRRTGVLRAGISANQPFTSETGGPEADVVTAFASSLGARVEWTTAAESVLFEGLERFELDVVVGGIDEKNPWAPKLGLTRPYLERDGKRHVIAVAPGENKLLLEFERALKPRAAGIAQRVGGKPL